MKTVFYLYVVGKEFIKINDLKITKTKSIEEAGYWTDMKNALSWDGAVKKKYPDAILKPAKLSIYEK